MTQVSLDQIGTTWPNSTWLFINASLIRFSSEEPMAHKISL